MTPSDRRTAIRFAHENALVWGIGNGLATITLVIYLALALGAQGIAISLLLAAAPLVGVLRLGTPAIIQRLGGRKPVCVGGYLASALVLLLVPLLSAPGVLSSSKQSIAALVILWAIYHLLEYIATVALWAWLRDIAPGPIRGTFVGYRERYLLIGRILGMLVGGLYAWQWRQTAPAHLIWRGYTFPTIAGAVMMLFAALLLLKMPHPPLGETRPTRHDYLAPLRDLRFRKLLLFTCWSSLVAGMTQAPQAMFPAKILGFSLLTMLSFTIGMRLGQTALAAPVGRWVDRLGNRPVMVVAQALAACGPLFFLAAGVWGPWWIAGAWVVWIGYIGLNIGLPNLMMKLSPPGKASTYIALYFAAGGLFAGVGTILGGVLFEKTLPSLCERQHLPFDHYQIMFIGGFITRALGILLLWRIIEPVREKKE